MVDESHVLSARVDVGDRTVIVLLGELDITGNEVLRLLLDTIRSAKWARVLVDLGELEFIDSSGLQALLDFSRELAQRGCVMDTRAPEGSMVRLLIDLTSTQRLLRLDR